MPRRKELPEALKNRMVEAYTDGECYKKLSKEYGVNVSILRQITYKWKAYSMMSLL